MTVRSMLDLPGIRHLRAHNLLFPAIVLLAVVAVLLHGAFVPAAEESAEAATEPPPPPPVFRPDYEKTPLAYTADYWRQVGEQWRPHIVLIGRDQTPGIIVGSRLAVSSIRAADDLIAEELALTMATAGGPTEGVSTLGADDQPLAADLAPSGVTSEPDRPYRLIAVDTDNHIAVFELSEARRAAPVADLSELQSGAHAAALSLTRDESLRITPGSVVSARVETNYPEQGSFLGDTLDLAIAFPEETRVAAIVDLDGGLLGVAFETPNGFKAIPAHIVRDLAREARESKPCISIEMQDLAEQVRTVLGVTEGVFVAKVRQEAFFPEPSIRAGDILVRWAGETVLSSQAFEELYLSRQPGSLARYVVLRNGRRLSGATRVAGPRCRPVGHGIVPFPRLGAVLRWDAAPATSVDSEFGWRVMSVVDDGVAARAGLQRGDLIVALQGRPLSPDNPRKSFEEFEDGPRPVVFTVSRNGRLQLVAVVPEVAPSPSG